jgi:Flp pilus assembly protein TadG
MMHTNRQRECKENKNIPGFFSSSSGTSMVLFAVSLSLLVACVGVAIDMGRILTARSRAVAALDAAILAAASRVVPNPSSEDIAALSEYANSYFRANYADEYAGVSPFTIRVDTSRVSAGVLAGFTTVQVPLAFGNFFGISQVDVPVGAQVSRALAKSLEVALVLDFTGSMCRGCRNPGDGLSCGLTYAGGAVSGCMSKFRTMKRATLDLLEALEDAQQTAAANGATVKVSFIPFGHGVKVNSELNLKTVFGLGESPDPDILIGNNHNGHKALPIVHGLTEDLDEVRDYVGTGTRAGAGGTNTATGILMGWKSLRWQNRGEFAGASAHKSPPAKIAQVQSGQVLKVMIVLSDGSNTIIYRDSNFHNEHARSDLHDSGTTCPGSTSAGITCAAEDAITAATRAKLEGVRIYTIALVGNDTTGGSDPTAARALMKTVASVPRAAHYFDVDPNVDADLREVFKGIANSLVDKIITK